MSRSFRAAAVGALALALTPSVVLAHGTTVGRTASATTQLHHQRDQVNRRTGAERRPAAQLAPGSGYQQAAGSPHVRDIQRRLARLGFAAGPIDGRYGPLTTRGVEQFQAAAGLTVDGIAGPHTLARLAAAGQTATAPGRGFRQAFGSPVVRSLQRRLMRFGVSPGPVDGRYGPLTMRAVRRFQHEHGLPATGLVDRATSQALVGNGQRRRRVRHPATPAPVQRKRPVARPPAARRHPGTPRHAPSGQVTAAPRATSPGASPSLTTILLVLTALGIAALGFSYARERGRRRRPTTDGTASPSAVWGAGARQVPRAARGTGTRQAPSAARQTRAQQVPSAAQQPRSQQVASAARQAQARQVAPAARTGRGTGAQQAQATTRKSGRVQPRQAAPQSGAAAITITPTQVQGAWAALTEDPPGARSLSAPDDLGGGGTPPARDEVGNGHSPSAPDDAGNGHSPSAPEDAGIGRSLVVADAAKGGRPVPALAHAERATSLTTNPVLVGVTTLGLATLAARYSRARRARRRSPAGPLVIGDGTRRRWIMGRSTSVIRVRGAAR